MTEDREGFTLASDKLKKCMFAVVSMCACSYSAVALHIFRKGKELLLKIVLPLDWRNNKWHSG